MAAIQDHAKMRDLFMELLIELPCGLGSGAGQEVDAEELLAMMVKRDRDDQERTLAPLQKAEDAIVIDTTSIDIQEVCRKMLEFVQSKKTS